MSLTTTRLELVSADSDAGLLTPGEVAALFRVDTKTVARWAKAGRLASIRTLGGHRRYPAAQFTTALTPTTTATTTTATTTTATTATTVAETAGAGMAGADR